MVGRWREIHPMMYALTVIAVGLLMIEHSEVFGLLHG
jgi:hypothetical protein